MISLESISHEELMNKYGVYYTMFTNQANRYEDEIQEILSAGYKLDQ